jgi:hypothetical protein
MLKGIKDDLIEVIELGGIFVALGGVFGVIIGYGFLEGAGTGALLFGAVLAAAAI